MGLVTSGMLYYIGLRTSRMLKVGYAVFLLLHLSKSEYTASTCSFLLAQKTTKIGVLTSGMFYYTDVKASRLIKVGYAYMIATTLVHKGRQC